MADATLLAPFAADAPSAADTADATACSKYKGSLRSPFLSAPLLPSLQRGEGNVAAIVDSLKQEKEEAEGRQKRRTDLLNK